MASLRMVVYGARSIALVRVCVCVPLRRPFLPLLAFLVVVVVGGLVLPDPPPVPALRNEVPPPPLLLLALDLD